MIVALKCSNNTKLWKILSQLEQRYSVKTGPELTADIFVSAVQLVMYLSKIQQYADDLIIVTSTPDEITTLAKKLSFEHRSVLLDLMNQCKPCKPSYVINLTELSDEINNHPSTPSFQVMINNSMSQILDSIDEALAEIATDI